MRAPAFVRWVLASKFGGPGVEAWHLLGGGVLVESPSLAQLRQLAAHAAGRGLRPAVATVGPGARCQLRIDGFEGDEVTR